MGIKITTDEYGVKVWRSDRGRYPSYAISLPAEVNGERVTEYQQLQFRRGVELQNGEEIFIQNAFPKAEAWIDKRTGELRKKEVWMVLEYTYKTMHQEKSVPEPIQRQKQPVQQTFDDLPDAFSQTEDDIPF